MRLRRRILKSLAAFFVVASAVSGAAASLGGIGPRNLGAGESAVSSCDNDGVTVSYTVSGGLVTQTTVGGIAPACVGGMLSLTLADGAGAGLGSGGPQAVGGTSVTVAMSPQPSASNVAVAQIVIAGP